MDSKIIVKRATNKSTIYGRALLCRVGGCHPEISEKNYPFNFLIFAILLIAGYWSMRQGLVMMENTKVDCKKDSTPMKVK